MTHLYVVFNCYHDGLSAYIPAIIMHLVVSPPVSIGLVYNLKIKFKEALYLGGFSYGEDLYMLDKINQSALGTFQDDIGIKIVELDPGWAVGELLVEKRHLSQGNHLHVGVFPAVASTTAVAGTIFSYPGQPFVAVSMSVSYIRAVNEGETVRAEAQARSQGKTASVWQVDCYNNDRKLVAVTTIDFRIL